MLFCSILSLESVVISFFRQQGRLRRNLSIMLGVLMCTSFRIKLIVGVYKIRERIHENDCNYWRNET